MTAIAQDFWQEQADEPEARLDSRVDAQAEDAYWQGAYWSETYHRDELEYEDYAPAYCVGYIGYAQYGGSFDDAEKSLCANWVRIKGASRLTLDEAMQSIRAAWDHASQSELQAEGEEEVLVDLALVANARSSQRQPAFA